MNITKKRVAMVLFAAVMIAVLLVPMTASANDLWTNARNPWRGSGWSSDYVYGRGWTESSGFTPAWIQVTVWLWEQETQGPVIRATDADIDYNDDYVSATPRNYENKDHRWYQSTSEGKSVWADGTPWTGTASSEWVEIRL